MTVPVNCRINFKNSKIQSFPTRSFYGPSFHLQFVVLAEHKFMFQILLSLVYFYETFLRPVESTTICQILSYVWVIKSNFWIIYTGDSTTRQTSYDSSRQVIGETSETWNIQNSTQLLLLHLYGPLDILQFIDWTRSSPL